MTKKRASKKPAKKTTPTGDADGQPPEPDLDRAYKLLMQLLPIPGPSCREGAVADFVRKQLRRAGVPAAAIETDGAHRRSDHGGETGNLVCRLPGTRRGPRRMLMAHLDTVPLCEGSQPVRRGNWIASADKSTGLGADDRAGVAVVLAVALEIVRRGLPHPPLTFFWSVQEEIGLIGARHARLGMLGKPKLAFNFDGGSVDKLTIGATGGYRMTIDVRGIASHAGGHPTAGVSAITIASLAIASLEEDGWLGAIQRGGGQGTANVGVIRGGDATNVVTPHVHLRAEARSYDPKFRRRIVGAIKRAFEKAARRVRNDRGKCGKVVFDGRLDYEAFILPDDEPCVAAAEKAVASAGGKPERSLCTGGLDANWMTARGIPAVTLGCGQSAGHTTAERLNVAQFHQGCRVALRLATGSEGS